MNVIVKKHYPVEKLPSDLREGLPLAGEVTVTIRGENSVRQPMTKEEVMAMLRAAQEANRGRGITPEDAAAQIRTLRDEWDD